MYVKRNVYFSAVDQKTGEEKLFSTTEIIPEESYQKEFAEKKEEEQPKKGLVKKVAKGAGIAAGGTAAVAGAAYGGEKLANVAGEKVVKKLTGVKGENGKFRALTKNEKTIKNLAKKAKDAKTIQNFAEKAIKKIVTKK